ncbi:unnamed protein product [Trichobilharzia regenti]|nr:unnamed protein product [Trichobilharzia regenti]
MISHSNRSEKQDVRRTNPGNSRLLNTECDYHRACSSSSSHNDFASPSSYEIDSQMYSLTCQSNQDDDVESTALMSPSPEVTPPYNLPSKISKRDSLLGLSYSRGVEDSRPASCETSPDPWRPTNRKIVISRTTGSKTDRFEGSSSHAVQSINTPHYANNETTNTTTTTTTTTTNPRDDLLNNNSTLSSSHVNPIRRSLSTSALPSKASFEPKVLKVRSKSYPALNRFLHSGYQKDYKSSVFLTISNCNHRYLSTDNYFPVGSIVSGGSTFVKRKLRRSTHRYASRLSNSNDTNSNTNTITTTSTAANRSFLHTNTRRPLTNVSPTSVLSEEGYSGRDEGDDPDFVDPDYDDEEELYVFSVPQTSLKRSSSHSISKYSTKRKRSVYSSTSSVHLASASIKQQYALRAENARLRRKLLDLMRQRGDLRAANEMLLEQNARLRQSSKRVSAVARMAESATKFIEAHKKSQLAQSNSSFSSAASAAQSTVPFSIAQAAAAAAVVAAAAQSETNPPNVTGVYVSSPTASIHHQHNSPTINAQGGGAGGGSSSMHPLFSQIASGNTISTGIAIPSNHALTAVQIQAPIAPPPPAPPPPHATALIHHPQGLHPQQQTGISNYYQHQV